MNRKNKKAIARAKARRSDEMVWSTVGFTMAMDQARKSGNVRMEYELTAAFAAARQDVQRFPPGANRAKLVHVKIDEIVEGTLAVAPDDKKPTCRAGCDHCCHMYVTANSDEADLLIEVAERKGIKLDMGLLKRQSKLEDENFFGLPKAERKCVFLGEGGFCQVYSDRPNACRTYYVITPPEICDLEQREIKVKRLNITMAEVLATGALSAANPKNVKNISLPAQLLAALKRKERL